MSCPCGKGSSTEECCGRFISGDAQPATAEELMRSRFTAYALGEIDYIVATHDPEAADQVDREHAEQWSKQSTWHGIEVLSTEAGEADDDQGEVEFIARYEVRGKRFSHHERAQFRKHKGHWTFVDGTMIKPKPVRVGPKPGRNDPCPCGSGKKYKKCCAR